MVLFVCLKIFQMINKPFFNELACFQFPSTFLLDLIHKVWTVLSRSSLRCVDKNCVSEILSTRSGGKISNNEVQKDTVCYYTFIFLDPFLLSFSVSIFLFDKVPLLNNSGAYLSPITCVQRQSSTLCSVHSPWGSVKNKYNLHDQHHP